MCQVSGKRNNFDFFGLNFGKLPNHVRLFGFYNFEGIGESWVEAEVSWVNVGGAGWRLVHGLAISMH